MKNICNTYLNKIKENRNNVYFSYKGYSGKNFNEELTFAEMINSEDKHRNKMKILVSKNNMNLKGNNFVIPTITCPKCGESVRIEIINYKIKLSQCKNGHITDNILLKEFDYYLSHDKTHMNANSNEKLYVCDKHYQAYKSYCESCHINLCPLCNAEHQSHQKIEFKYIMPNKYEIKEYRNYLNKFKKMIILFNNNIQLIINSLVKVSENIGIYYKITENILNSFDIKKINYETLYNLKQIKEKNIIKELENIINESSIRKKFNDIFNIYCKMSINEISIVYKADKKEVKLFNNDFIEKNKNYCKVVIDGKEEDLKEFQNIPSDKKINKFEIKIKLKGIMNITDISSMFRWCKSLLSLPDISKWDTSNITNMNGIFYKCESLSTLPDLSRWNTSNVKDISSMFYGCSSLLSLPDISKWNTSNVTNMSFLFYGCSLLTSLPNISKWNTNNVTDMIWMFYQCNSLVSLPDISNWNTSNVTSMREMFYGCVSLKALPDFSKWNTSRVTDMSYMFYECKSLIYLPDISSWNTSMVNNMREMFCGCSSLKSLPDLSKWNISKVNNMVWIFNDCNENINIPLKFQQN